MRRVLFDYARTHNRWKLPEDKQCEPIKGPEVFCERPDFEAAVSRLEALDPCQDCLVELLSFTGLTNEQIADAFRIWPKTSKLDWYEARVWLWVDRSRE